MRVGVVVDLGHPNIGGARVFADSVMDGLQHAPTHHEILLLHTGEATERITESPGWEAIDLRAGYEGSPERSKLKPASRGQVQRAARRAARAYRARIGTIGPTPVQRAARDLNLDVVWFTNQRSELIEVPFFATVWDLEHRKQPFFPEVNYTGSYWEAREEQFGRTLPRAARIFTGTHAGKDEIVHYYRVNPANVVVNPFPVPTPAGDSRARSSSDVLAAYALQPGFLLYPAQFWPHKNHVTLLRALRMLESEHGLQPDLVLTGSDKGNQEYIRSVIADLGLEKRVHILGFVSTTDLETLYREASMLVFPTFFGPDNIPPLEAFALGCTVVASDIPGAREQLGDAALLFDPARPDDMAAKVAAVLGRAELKDQLRERGLKAIATRTPRVYVDAVMRLLDAFEPIRRNWLNGYRHT